MSLADGAGICPCQGFAYLSVMSKLTPTPSPLISLHSAMVRTRLYGHKKRCFLATRSMPGGSRGGQSVPYDQDPSGGVPHPYVTRCPVIGHVPVCLSPGKVPSSCRALTKAYRALIRKPFTEESLQRAFYPGGCRNIPISLIDQIGQFSTSVNAWLQQLSPRSGDQLTRYHWYAGLPPTLRNAMVGNS
jgi:hypothetical protein